MQKVLMTIGMLIFGLCSNVTAQDKVVVVPLGSSGKAGGTDMQVQYNDNGNLAGAMVFYDKNTGHVGIGNENPAANFDILDAFSDAGTIITSGTRSYILLQSAGNDDTKYPMILGAKARGTVDTAFEPPQTGTPLFGIFARGQVTTSSTPNIGAIPSAHIVFVAAENWTETARGSFISLATTENQTATKVVRMRIDHNGNVGIGTTSPLSKLAVSGLPTTPPDASGNAGVVCVTVDGNFWLDDDGTADCQ